MSTNPTIRTRSERVATLQVDSFWHRIWVGLTQRVVLLRLLIAIGTAILITVAVRGWNPPFAYRQGYIPPRSIVARVYFEMIDVNKTAVLRAQASREVICLYENRHQAISQLRSATKDQVLRLRGTGAFNTLTPPQIETLEQFLPPNKAETTLAPQDALAALQSVMDDDSQIERFDLVIRGVLAPLEETGLLKNLGHTIDEGNQRFIRVFDSGQENETIEVEVQRVRIAEVSSMLRESLVREFRREFNKPEAETVAAMVANYLQTRLPETLSLRQDLTEKARAKKEQEVAPAKFIYYPSKTTMVPGGKALRAEDISILRSEYNAWIDQQSVFEQLIRLTAFSGMIAASYLLCGLFFHFQFDRSLLTDTWKLVRLLGLSVLCITLCSTVSRDPWRAEVVPIVICAATATIAYGRNVTLVLLTALALCITLALGMDLAEFVVLISAGAATTLLLGRIRTRTRLIYVTTAASLVTAFTTVGVGVMVGQIHGNTTEVESVPVLGLVTAQAGSMSWGHWDFMASY